MDYSTATLKKQLEIGFISSTTDLSPPDLEKHSSNDQSEKEIYQMALPRFTIRDLLEAGVHYGHTTRRWNPKMKPYIFGARNNIHIIDLQQTVPLLQQGLEVARQCVAKGGRVLFVATKQQAVQKVAQAAKNCGQYYINNRWLGGTLTNWKTVHQSIKRMREMKEVLDNPGGLKKKEVQLLSKKYEKLQANLGGISEMGGVPNLLIVIDTIKEKIAIEEASRLKIPVIAIVDSNSDPDGITYPVPGNDDAIRSLDLYLNLFSAAILEGLQESMAKAGYDLGASADLSPMDITDMAGHEGMQTATSSESTS
jgi:small subunit ribosomal protein S2